MSNLFNNTDGADSQAQAVLAYLRQHDGLESSYMADEGYTAEPKVHRWHNLREQGYVICLRSKTYGQQINIAFFEHRNSDGIHAILWEQLTLNPPTIDNAEFGEVYKDKYDTSHNLGYGKPDEMADWIYEQLETFWRLS